MKLIVIANPYANRWNARGRLESMHAALRAVGIEYELIETTEAGHAVRAAREACATDCDAVVAAGGDGTVHEVVNGLLLAAGDGVTRPLGIMPLGTGNDLADELGIPRDLSAAAGVIAAGVTRRIDACRVKYCVGDTPPVERFFANNCAVAMEPMVTIENTRIRRLSGNLRYVASLVQALRKLKAWRMRIRWDDCEYDGPVYLLSVCNGPRCGGIFRMAPDARFDDGMFDVVLAPKLSTWELLSVLRRLFRGGHVRHPKVMYRRARQISIESNPGTPIHADGEVLTEAATRIEYEMLVGRLRVLADRSQ